MQWGRVWRSDSSTYLAIHYPSLLNSLRKGRNGLPALTSSSHLAQLVKVGTLCQPWVHSKTTCSLDVLQTVSLSFKSWLTKDTQTAAAINGCLQFVHSSRWEQGCPIIHDSHSRSTMPTLSIDGVRHYSSYETDTLSNPYQTKAAVRSWKASTHCDTADGASYPTLYLAVWWYRRHFMFHREIHMHAFPQEFYKIIFISCSGPRPSMSWSATVWFITEKGGHTLTYRQEHKHPS